MEKFLKVLGLYKINGFTFIKEIETGEASTVCLYKKDDNENRIIKMLIVPKSEEELEYFKNEVKALNEINEKNNGIVPKTFSECVQHKDYPIYYYVMEYIDGMTLNDFRTKPLRGNLERFS